MEALHRGTAFFDREHYDAALTEYLAAYDALGGHPRQHRVLYNIALSYERSFRYDEAVRFYRRYLEEGGAAEPQAPEVRAILEALELLLGTVRVLTELDDVEIWVDDHQVSDGTQGVRLPAGTHIIEVRADHHIPARRQARVTSGRETVLRIELESVESFRGLPNEVFWTGVAVTLATLVAGASFGVESLVDTRELELRLAGDDRWSVTQAQIDAVEDLSLAADVLFVSGGLFGITSLVLGLLTDWRSTDRSARAGVRVGHGGFTGWF